MLSGLGKEIYKTSENLGRNTRKWAKIIEKYKVLKSFKGRTNSDLYVWIVKHWDNLKSIYGLEYLLNEAAWDFKQKYGVTKAEYIKLFLQAFFKRKK